METAQGVGDANPALSEVLLEELFGARVMDRRWWPRRGCAAIRVFVSQPETGRLWQGCLLDSSSGGLGVKLMGPLPPMGTIVQISRCSVPALEASVLGRVVHGRQDHNCCVIGCEFVNKPSPSVLVLFS